MATEFHPAEPERSRFLEMIMSMNDSPAADMLEFVIPATGENVGGAILAHHDMFCYPLFDFLDKQYRGKGLFPSILSGFQATATRDNIRFLIGDVPHHTLRRAYRRIYERLGACVLYTRCYYATRAAAEAEV